MPQPRLVETRNVRPRRQRRRRLNPHPQARRNGQRYCFDLARLHEQPLERARRGQIPDEVHEQHHDDGEPADAVERVVRLLEEAGFIQCVERRLTQAGKRISLYKSNVKNAQIIVERNKLRARIEMIDGSLTDTSYDLDMSMFMEQAKAL